MPLTIKGRKLSFAWLKPPPAPPDGSMTLFEHLKELRYRLVVASLAIVIATIAAFAFNGFLFQLLIQPYTKAIALAKQTRPDLQADLVIQGATAPFTVSLKISLLAGLILSAPIWLYQIWAFIVPGLLAKEKKWTLIVVGAATPLFIAGIALGYYVMPKGIAVLINFTPDAGVANLQDLGDFLSFMTRLMIVFGLAFEVPLFILLLNVTGILPAKVISKYRSYIIFGVFVFAAVATPTPDAITMLLLATPMVVLVIAAEIIAHALDRSRNRKKAAGEDVIDYTEKDAALKAMEVEDERKVLDTGPGASANGSSTNGSSTNGHRSDSSEAINHSYDPSVERDEDPR
ncbi:twin-arginine translocase subunit TatC [Microlunatus ginsengisoli]|uniref:Sec-independent protein translocase protein TatC n=1 Tax=Microlunatus ginsengisoli TaxID=363863 RepID=A0ABP7A380_9ACTN